MYEIFYFMVDSRITYKLRDEDTISWFSRDIPTQIWIVYDQIIEVITLQNLNLNLLPTTFISKKVT